MDLWSTRTASIRHLEENCKGKLDAFAGIFGGLDRCIDVYEAEADTSTYARVCGLTVLKAKHLAVGAYSLVLDGLGQEAGALMRPLIEYIELLTYFNKFPQEVAKAVDGDLPRAGERAKAVGGIYQQFREHLNEHASHSAYSHFALAHLLEPGSLKFKKLQRAVPQVLERNVRDLAVQLVLLLCEAVIATRHVSESAFVALAELGDDVRYRVMHEFSLGAP